LGGKAYASCNVIHDSQMMVIGGSFVDKTNQDCDLNTNAGQRVVLLGQESVEYAEGGTPAW
jgi:hypothetical protein